MKAAMISLTHERCQIVQIFCTAKLALLRYARSYGKS